MKYRAEIDGLRALAIVPVVLYHAGFEFIKGGYLGVDIFFVISGYLISSLLLAELQQHQKINIVRFYERRARRILPALVVVIASTTVASYFLLFTPAWKTYLQSILSITFFGSNYFFKNKSGYFDPKVDLNPMLHTWSLSIEEQFYVLFPLVLFVLWKYVPAKFRMTSLILIAGFGLVLADGNSASDPSGSFYVIQSRLWELVVGAIVALVGVHSRREFKSNSTSALALIVLAVTLVAGTSHFPHPGFVTAIPVISAGVLIGSMNESTFAGWILSRKYVVQIGLISYSLYLWHQPIFAIMRISSLHKVQPNQLIPYIFLACLLAYLSWKFVETPFRNKTTFESKKIWRLSATSLAFIVSLSFVGQLPSVIKTRVAVTGINFSKLESSFNQVKFPLPGCHNFMPDSPNCRSGATPKVLLWGDSFATAFAPALSASKTNSAFVLNSMTSCSPVLGSVYQDSTHGQKFAERCFEFNDKTFSWLEASEIQLVILTSPWEILNPDTLSSGRDFKVGRNSEIAKRNLLKTIAKINELGISVSLVLPPPSNGDDLGSCARVAKLFAKSPSECDFNIHENQYRVVTDVLNSLNGPKISHVDLSSLICQPSGVCNAIQDDIIMFRDIKHLTANGSNLIGRKYDIYGEILRNANEQSLVN